MLIEIIDGIIAPIGIFGEAINVTGIVSTYINSPIFTMLISLLFSILVLRIILKLL